MGQEARERVLELRCPVAVPREIGSLSRMNDDRMNIIVSQQRRDLVFGDWASAGPSQDTIKDRVSIHERPKTVDGRTEGGHWEGDLIICKRTRPVLVLHERKSRVTLAARLAGKTAAETISVMLAVFARIEPALRKSITFDNDTAFAQHALLRTMHAMTTWFCDAYASWQKGGVENANGRLRRWLPRQIDIDQVSDEEIQDIVITADLTPRKCLGFKTPFQAILKLQAQPGQRHHVPPFCD